MACNGQPCFYLQMKIGQKKRKKKKPDRVIHTQDELPQCMLFADDIVLVDDQENC